MRPLFAALLACGMIVSASATAQDKPKLEMHRSNVSAMDASGWQVAASSRGSFSVRLPIPFNDFSVHSTDPKAGDTILHAVGGKSSEGIKMTATEAAFTAQSKAPADIGTMPEQMGRSPGSKVSEIRRDKQGEIDSIRFLVTGPATSAYIRYVKTPKALYTLIVEFPREHANTVAGVKDQFLDSLKLKD